VPADPPRRGHRLLLTGVRGSEVFRRALGHVAAARLRIEVDRQVVAALRAAAPGPCLLLLRVGRDAGLDPAQASARAAACFLAFAAFNLSDDLSDGDCDYLEPAPAQAVVLVLHTLFSSALEELVLPPSVTRAVHRDLLAAEEAQVLETTTSSWDAERLRVVTDGIAGRQWSAYLRIMWAGTPWEPRAPDVARDFSRVALLAGDILSEDPRWTTLPPAERRSVMEDALAGVTGPGSVEGQLARFVTEECQPVLEQAMADLATDPIPSVRGVNAVRARPAP
jgi:hypothetical protein